jgi:LmbE family N-acetylglucosaminyl deacetylase
VSSPPEHSHQPPGRLLVVVAHPRDADLALAGSVARWVAGGTVAWLVCCTSGDGRSDDASADPLELAATREREQRAAAEVVGYASVTFLHQPEGALANDLALREQLVRLIRQLRPDALATHDPRVIVSADGYVNHVDHRACGAAAIDAARPAAANAMAFPELVRSEGLEPHAVERLYLFWSERPDLSLDVSESLGLKQRALAEHASQAPRGTAVATETFTLVDLRD